MDNSWAGAYWWLLSRLSSLSVPRLGYKTTQREGENILGEYTRSLLCFFPLARLLVGLILRGWARDATDFLLASFFPPFFAVSLLRCSRERRIVKSDTEEPNERKTDAGKFSTLQVVSIFGRRIPRLWNFFSDFFSCFLWISLLQFCDLKLLKSINNAENINNNVGKMRIAEVVLFRNISKNNYQCIR